MVSFYDVTFLSLIWSPSNWNFDNIQQVHPEIQDEMWPKMIDDVISKVTMSWYMLGNYTYCFFTLCMRKEIRRLGEKTVHHNENNIKTLGG